QRRSLLQPFTRPTIHRKFTCSLDEPDRSFACGSSNGARSRNNSRELSHRVWTVPQAKMYYDGISGNKLEVCWQISQHSIGADHTAGISHEMTDRERRAM